MRSSCFSFCFLALLSHVQSVDNTKQDNSQLNLQNEARSRQNTDDQHYNAWQSVFSAANEAYRLYTNYEQFKQRAERIDLELTTKQLTTEEDDTESETTINPSIFVSFEAVPSKHDIEEEKIEIEYVPYNEELLKRAGF